MNDLAQTVVGGVPPDGGDLLCRVIREGVREDEDNSEATLRADRRFAAAFTRAYPVELGSAQVRRIRLGARALLNVDAGMYAPGTQMASSVATHKALLGGEGFRRFHMGAYLATILGEESRASLCALYASDNDPVSCALKPLFQRGELQPDRSGPRAERPLTPFDSDLGRALGLILRQPLSKPAVLRAFALGGCLGFVLKVFGAGMPDGRPVLLALAADQPRGTRPLREKAVLSLRRGVAALDRHVATLLAASEHASQLWRQPKSAEAAIEVQDGPPQQMALALIEALRRGHSGGDEADAQRIYWPHDAMLSLGRRAGVIQPKTNALGWGSYLALSPEMIEVLTLMTLPWGTRRSWRVFWAEVRDRLGIVVGANDDHDLQTLRLAGVAGVSLEDLSDNAELLLAQSVRRGVARRLPDSGAEVGGYEA
jgi:hypothetical protein